MYGYEIRMRVSISELRDDISDKIRQRTQSPVYLSVATLAELRDNLDKCLHTLDMAAGR